MAGGQKGIDVVLVRGGSPKSRATTAELCRGDCRRQIGATMKMKRRTIGPAEDALCGELLQREQGQTAPSRARGADETVRRDGKRRGEMRCGPQEGLS